MRSFYPLLRIEDFLSDFLSIEAIGFILKEKIKLVKSISILERVVKGLCKVKLFLMLIIS